jgi:hypothetical protein
MAKIAPLELEELDSETLCPNCQGLDSIYDSHRGEIICNRCGMVLRDRIINPGAEWRAFDSDQREKRTRTGAPMTFCIHDQGLRFIAYVDGNLVFGFLMPQSVILLLLCLNWIE